eukprot:TRINITY_DN170_c0_g1_i2.p1 TRINITY_DN170_c0_g1~~TRINITY_DN170_c0_g1_i2.p1  ORF type:complete len:222 (-),score=6.30 TRINITY_DN170_c0_g1_i2:111-776(-)
MVERFDLPRDLDVKAGSIVPSLDKMYFPAHARFGAFVVGAILALRLRKCNKKRGNFDFILSGILYIVFLGMSLSVILVPMLPIPPEVPKEAQFFSGVFLRHAYSLSVSFLLFSATCPPKHPFYSPLLRTALSFKFMYPLSKLTFVIYLTHVRVQLQILKYFTVTPQELTVWTVLSVYVTSLCICASISLFVYLFVEGPTSVWRRKLIRSLFPRRLMKRIVV